MIEDGKKAVVQAGRREFLPIALLGGAAGAAWVFLALAGEVVEGEMRAFDERLLLALRTSTDSSNPLGPPWLEEVGRDLSALGGTGVMVLLVVSVTLFLALARRQAEAMTLTAAAMGATAIELTLKGWYGRPRPDLVPHGARVFTASFPSGHATLSAAVFLTAGALLAHAEPDLRLKVYFSSLAVLLTVLVGASRVYLGVHWPTDVLAGWVLGAGWAATCWGAALWLGRDARSRRNDRGL
ncbi:phosphatase PAP2 family protein [Roseicella aquatilis]|uniref:Phosphatase PAP2 family protein n=1 Tax=Roseicella aquatilis TaxID=2527868 RepID=A0A4R4DKN3_9PROT|nr:phosphatase PAP2 family protein [Roseicella aquatilis]TCZ61032.1 phosphatase PAP2 family protein [Roseicella aquatilis]